MTTPAMIGAPSRIEPLGSSRENEQAQVDPPTLTLIPGGGHDRRDMGSYTLEVKSLAETLTDIERVRIAAENRHRSIVQAGEEGTAAEQQAGKLAQALATVEHEATLSLQRAVRKHPLGLFVKRTIGLGEKQGARLIASIEDPYWNTLHDRPRTVSELWAYCGFHVLHPGHVIDVPQEQVAGVDPSRPSQLVPGTQEMCAGATPFHPGHSLIDAHRRSAGVDPSAVTGHARTGARATSARDGDLACSPPGHDPSGSHDLAAGVAARRRKGQKANWSNEAKMRARLCAESCIKQAHSPYRPVYDASRAADAGRGLTPLHEHNRALRKVAKALLKDLWREARDWHTAEGGQ